MANTESEVGFFDDEYSSNGRSSVGQIYSIANNRNRLYDDMILNSVSGKKVLAYGCGLGTHSREIARHGGDVIGIDISPRGIEEATKLAERDGLTNVSYQLMDAEKLTFSDNSFDIVFGEGILHHLDLNRSYSEIARVLKPEGRAIFQEPLGHNPAIVLFRRLTPKLRTPDEHPLVLKDLEHARSFFADVNCTYFHLFSFSALLLLKTPYFFPSVNALDRFDAWVLRRFPFLSRFAWYAVMEMSKPKKEI